MTSKGLILLDWDKTVVDEHVQINDPDFSKAIQAKKEQGWQIGLNSDTPLRRLKAWHTQYDMDGPIIAERGAVIWWPNGPELVVDQPLAKRFSKFRTKLILRLIQLDNHTLVFGDNTEFIKSVEHIVSNDSVLVALDAYRRCSIGLFVRNIVEPRLVSDAATTESIHQLLQSIIPSDSKTYKIEPNHAYGYIRVNAVRIMKSTGMHYLLENWPQAPAPDRIFMIGDSLEDNLGISEIHQLAVCNADEAYLKRAEHQASQSYAKGCVELLTQYIQ